MSKPIVYAWIGPTATDAAEDESIAAYQRQREGHPDNSIDGPFDGDLGGHSRHGVTVLLAAAVAAVAIFIYLFIRD